MTTVIEIPERLKQEGIKFVLLERSGKKPFQKDWQNKIIYFNEQELINHIQAGGNYGIMGGGQKNLIIIDFDDEKVQNEVCKKLPETFTVKTGSGKLHKYFFSDNTESFKIFDEEMNTLADVQGVGKQVVGAGSIHPNGNKYEVIDDREISFIPYSEIKAILFPYNKKKPKEEKVFEKPKIEITDDFVDKIKSYVSIKDVLNSFGVDTNKNPTDCPFHSSKGGKCLGFNNETAHCFHCDGSWNIFSFVKDFKKCDFKEALEYLAGISGLENELEKSRRNYFDKIKDVEQEEKRNIRIKFIEYTTGKEKYWSEATEMLVDYVKKKMIIYSIKDDKINEMWIYKDGIYIPQGRSEIKILLRDLLGDRYSQFVFGKVIDKIEPDTSIDPKLFFNQCHKYEVPVLNGILNVFTRELKPFTSEKIFFSKLPVTYNPSSSCPQIEKFLVDTLSNEEDKSVFYEIGGFCLIGDYTFEKAFMFVGNGRNGKDKSLELIKRLMGIENCCSIPLASLDSTSFVISEFFGKKVNLSGEISNQDLKDTSMFKALTGRSLINAKRKFLNDISFVNYAKFIFACNDLPMVYDFSRGFWDRWVLLEFPFTFVTEEEYNNAKDKSLMKLRDENIIDKITTDEELSGLLNKFLDGLARLFMNKNFSITKGTDEIKKLWIRRSNSFYAFCVDMIEQDYDNSISKKELRRIYANYCKTHKVIPKSDNVIKRILQDEYGATESQDYESKNRIWEGIKWKTTIGYDKK